MVVAEPLTTGDIGNVGVGSVGVGNVGDLGGVGSFNNGGVADLRVGVDVSGFATLKEKIVFLNPVVDFGVFRALDTPVVVRV